MTRLVFHWRQPVAASFILIDAGSGQAGDGAFTGIGTNGWLNVMDTLGALPIQAPVTGNDMMFLVYGFMGTAHNIGVNAGAAQGTLDWMSAEVGCAVGNVQETDFANSARVQLNSPQIHLNLEDNGTRQRGHPFHFMVRVNNYQHATAPFRVIARIRDNGVEQGFSRGAFVITGLSIIAFDLDLIGSANYFYEQSPFGEFPGTGMIRQDQPNSAATDMSWTSTGSLPWAADEENWMIFTNHVCTPRSNFAPYLIQMIKAGTPALWFVDLPMGAAIRGNLQVDDPNPGPFEICRDSIGSFSALTTVTASGDQFEVRGVSSYPGDPGRPQSRWHGSQVFALRHTFGHTGTLRVAQRTPTDANGVGRYGNHANNPSQTPTERAAIGVNIMQVDPNIAPPVSPPANTVPYMIIADAGLALGSASMSAGLAIFRDVTTSLSTNLIFKQYVWREPSSLLVNTERLPHMEIADFIPRFGTNLITVRGFFNQFTPQDATIASFNAQAIGFFMDDAPPLAPAGPLTPGAEVILPVGREGLGLGSLNTIPSTPNAVQPLEDVGLSKTTFVTETGRVITWPKFITPRIKSSFVWTGQTQAQRDTLEQFFHDQADVIFKATLQGETTERAFVAVTELTSTEIASDGSAITYECKLEEVVELVWVGA